MVQRRKTISRRVCYCNMQPGRLRVREQKEHEFYDSNTYG